MSARDVIHQTVKNALINDGWIVTHDPYVVEYEELTMYADLGAERVIAAERDAEKIVVEVKSFTSRSPVQDLKLAIGQYLIYLGYLEVIDPDRKLYLAISSEIYHDLFSLKAVQFILGKYHVAMLVINLDKEEVILYG